MKVSHAFIITLLFVSSAILHFGNISYPNEAVFDEVHFGKFVSGYLKGEYFFDIHPPLGKLAIAGFAKLAGADANSSFESIGVKYPDSQYIWLRFLPALLGSLLVPLIYLLTLRISGSTVAARLSGIFMLFENALLVQSKFILMDSFLLFFGFLGLYLFLQSKVFFESSPWGKWVIWAAAISAGCAFSVKWTGGAFLLLMIVFALSVLIKKIMREKKIRAFGMISSLAVLFTVPVIIYGIFFYIHFALLPHEGPGDGFMSPALRESRAKGYPLSDFPANIIELNKEMFESNQRLSATHPYGSLWYTWPFMKRSIYYWNFDMPNSAGYQRIYLLGNPFIWWLSTILTFWYILRTLGRYLDRLWRRRRSSVPFSDTLLTTGYLLNYLPFIFIGRVMFLYHYLSALIFAIMISAIIIAEVRRMRTQILAGTVAAVIIVFFIISPVTFGTTLYEPWPGSIFWLKSWI